MRQVSVVFFGRLAYIFANTFARVFWLVRRFGARAIRRRFRQGLRRLFALLLRPGSVLATVRYYFDLLRVFAVCLLDI
jgi:hypothetical protein